MPTADQITKLPVWAQNHLAEITRQRNEAVESLRQFQDRQTVSRISYTEHLCIDGILSTSTVYVQTDKIMVNHGGVNLEVLVRPDEPEIELTWRAGGVLSSWNNVGMIPKSGQQVVLRAAQHMDTLRAVAIRTKEANEPAT